MGSLTTTKEGVCMNNQMNTGKTGKRQIAAGLVIAGFILAIGGAAFGVSGYLSDFNARYGTTGTSLDTCNLCHTGTPRTASNLNAYGTAYMNSGYNFAAIESVDSDGDGYSNLAEIQARTFPGDASSHPVADATPPTVTGFIIPSTSSSLVVDITTFTATDNTGVTGYLITETAVKPASSATGWTGTAPTSYTFTTAGSKTLYAWAKDAAGNVSTVVVSASVTITLPDTTPPVVTGFTIPTTSSSLVVDITTFTATDNTGVTGYLITTSSTPPALSATGWTGTAPTSYTFTTAGSKTLYAWAKDAAGNVSTNIMNASVTITVADVTPPVVTDFTIPASSGTFNVPITTFTATDDTAVTGYLITEASAVPLATDTGWTGTAPTSYTFTTAGSKTLYAWAKDAAGNVSTNIMSASVTITLADATPPTVTAFEVPAAYGTLKVPITNLTAVDNTAVTGYLVTETSTKPSSGAAGWTLTPPADYTFTSAGIKTLYAWAKDAAGNISTNIMSASVTITVADTAPPVVTAFVIPSTSSSLIVPITTFTATDNVEVTGYFLTTTAAQPGASAQGWSATPPTSYTFDTAGSKTLYAWAKDAAGNVSAGKTDSVRIRVTITDRTPPVVTAFEVSEETTSLTVPITVFTATDNTVVAAYMVTTSSFRPSWFSTKWSPTPPDSFTFKYRGTKRLYPWVKDGAGNVSRKYTGGHNKVVIKAGEAERSTIRHEE